MWKTPFFSRDVAQPSLAPSSLPIFAFHLFANWGISLLGTGGRGLGRCLPIEPDYLRYPWVGDLARMHEELAFVPRNSAAETLREFAAKLRLGRYRLGSISLARDEDQLRDAIERRRDTQERQAPPSEDADAAGVDDD